MLIQPNGKVFGSVGGGTLENDAIAISNDILKSFSSKIKTYTLREDGGISDSNTDNMICGGEITIFFEYIEPPNRAYIFGAGHVGKALLYHLAKSDWHVTIIDCREEIIKNIDGANRIVIANYNTAFEKESIPPGGYFLITTHSHETDGIILNRIYQSQWNPAYIGMLASTRKAKYIIDNLRNTLGYEPDFSKLYTPVGIDIGGSSPDEIAISIVAQMQSIRYGIKNQRHLRKLNF